MNSLACQCIEEYRESSHEGLTLTGSHLGDLTLMKDDTSDELHVIMDHVPGNLITAGHPMVLPDRIVALDGHEFLSRAEVTVKLCGLYLDDRILGETTGSRLHDSECLRKDLVEYGLDSLVHLLHELVLLGSEGFLLLERNLFFKLLPDLGDTVLIICYSRLDLILQSLTSCPEGIIVQNIYFLICLKHLVQGRPEGFHVTVRLGTEKFLENVCK